VTTDLKQTLFLYDMITTEFGDTGMIVAFDKKHSRVLISTTDGVLYWVNRVVKESYEGGF
jgi:hypothetical protein